LRKSKGKESDSEIDGSTYGIIFIKIGIAKSKETTHE